MRILMVSMFSNHFIRWTEQLKDSGHEIYWLDVFDSNTYVEKISFVSQIIGWRHKYEYPGRYMLKKKSRLIYNLLNKYNQRDLEEIFEEQLIQIKPDLVHSFILQSGTYPIKDVMTRYPEIKWAYSAWGNDLYYRQKINLDMEKIQETLPEIDYMFADCHRDSLVAKSLGFEGNYLGTFPTGGGYELEIYDPYVRPFDKRNTILIKGYQSHLGRCNIILEAIKNHRNFLKDIEIVVFGGNKEVIKFCENNKLMAWENFTLLYNIPHGEVLNLLGKSLIYIGNSISDGMPNTLLEAIIMGAFPIQSNPGGATAEIIKDQLNGVLINDPEDPGEIWNKIQYVLNNPRLIKEGIAFNNMNVRPNLEREFIKKQVIEKYEVIQNSLK